MKNRTALLLSVYKNDTQAIVQECLDSIFEQTLQNFDIFIQSDGVINQELEQYLDMLTQENSVYSFHKRQENRGLAYSLNELIERVSLQDYDYIFRMDADDIMMPYRIEHQLNFLKSHPDIDVLGGWIEEFNTDTHERQCIQYSEYHREILEHMLKRNPMAHVSIAFKADFFKRFSLYNPHSKNEDFALWVDAFSQGAQFHNLQEVLVKVRTNNAFYSRRRDNTRALEVMKIKWRATKIFGFGVRGYLYAVAHYLLFMAPGPIKQFIYKIFR